MELPRRNAGETLLYGAPLWRAETPYPAGEVVFHAGYAWEAIQPSLGREPCTEDVQVDPEGATAPIWRRLNRTVREPKPEPEPEPVHIPRNQFGEAIPKAEHQLKAFGRIVTPLDETPW